MCGKTGSGEVRRKEAGSQTRAFPKRPVYFAAVTKSTGDDWLGVPALGKELGVTTRTVYAILDSGDIPSYRIRRVIRIKRVDVEEYERCKVQPGELSHLYPPGENGVPPRKR